MGGNGFEAAASSLAVADEALRTIANEHRLHIVALLGDACSGGEYGSLRYSDILHASEIDDSGKLNYHLQRLVEQEYVVKEAGAYRLSLRGLKAYQAVKAGFYAEELEVDPVPLDTPHYACGEPLYARYRDQRVVVECRACDDVLHRYPVPPGPFEAGSSAAMVHAFDKRFTLDILSMSLGVCPYCSGPTERELGHEHLDRMDVDDWEAPALLFWCTHCHWFLFSTLDAPLLFHPRVMAFFFERGVDVWETPRWAPELEVDDAVVSEEPWEIGLEFTCDGDALELVVDGELNVVRSRVERAP